MLQRILEPEVMNTAQDASEYAAMDHREVNREFAVQALAIATEAVRVLDLGTGPALIPIELARLKPTLEFTAIDLATHMLDMAQRNVAAAGLTDRIRLEARDVKATGFEPGTFDLILCNSVVHHMPNPTPLFREVARLLGPTTRVLIKDLVRPATEAELETLVAVHAASDTPYQRQLFADSLRAALTEAEATVACMQAGLGPVVVKRTSDRHYCITLR